MALHVVPGQPPRVPYAAAVKPAIEGLEETLRLLSPEHRDWTLLRRLHRHLTRLAGASPLRPVREEEGS